MPFSFERLSIPDVVLVKPRVFKDNRGFFVEIFKRSDFDKFGIGVNFVQDNFSHSVKGVLRGLHFQLNPFAQGKLVRCLRGKIYDVAVDLRRGSPTFGKWVGVELSGDNHWMLWIPEGFAHGFLVISEEAYVFYKVSGAEYRPEAESGVRWDDPKIGIKWPLDQVDRVILSQRDADLPFLDEAEINFSFGG